MVFVGLLPSYPDKNIPPQPLLGHQRLGDLEAKMRILFLESSLDAAGRYTLPAVNKL